MRVEHLTIFLVVVGFAILVLIWNRVLDWFCIRLSDWPSVAARYPSQLFCQPREVFKSQTGVVGKLRLRRGFMIELFEEGLKITLDLLKLYRYLFRGRGWLP
jgi:hypothetical protein